MKKLVSILFCAMALMFSSCGLLSHNTANLNENQTQVILQKKNYHIVKAVTGKSQQVYVFGIGGLSPKSLKDDAIRDMYRNAELTGSQAIINENVTVHNNIYLFIYQKKVVATGLVIEFDE